MLKELGPGCADRAAGVGEARVVGKWGQLSSSTTMERPFEIEVTTLNGETAAVATVEAANVRPVGPSDMPPVGR
jgi:hypothetical protein